MLRISRTEHISNEEVLRKCKSIVLLHIQSEFQRVRLSIPLCFIKKKTYLFCKNIFPSEYRIKKVFKDKNDISRYTSWYFTYK